MADAATVPKRRRNLSLISNLLYDLGLNEIQQIFALFILILTISGVRFYYGQPLIPRGAAPRKKTRNLKSPGGRGGTNHKGRAKGKDV
eukprot:CAMPEP_0171818244 /NCGR_PEP_ID=MMETSP0992-20121227/1546_1 /TAXON_ID=483369 /ORGANISM="non described non described, Strain CCMP2098" /LENGTH=87 /DNA_ID=CAMNT_0012432387 /DNA_START=180 /DNA_END=443 /DNA_ORIENTATION=-